MSQQMLASYYLLPTIGRLFLWTVVWHIFVTRLFGVIFRLFQSCLYDNQTNGARVRATGIVGILTQYELDVDCSIRKVYDSYTEPAKLIGFIYVTFGLVNWQRNQVPIFHGLDQLWVDDGIRNTFWNILQCYLLDCK